MAAPGQKVLRVICRSDGAVTPADGRFVVEYDPRLVKSGSDRWLEGPWTFVLRTSPDIHRARGFPDVAAALEYWRRVCPNFPTRTDGKPNRPLTVYTCEIDTVPGRA